MADKPKLGMYWAASCGGCEVALVNLHEKILDVDAAFEFMFCPCLLDTKKKDIEALPDGAIAITLFNGAIRTDENLEMARLLRAKSRTLIAFGSCSSEGCIPGLANLHDREAIFRTVYLDSPSTVNPEGIIPRPTTSVPGGELHIPAFHERVRTLADVTDVDYFVPGCPPEPHRIWEVVEAVIGGGPLPPKGSVIGAGRTTVCEECARPKQDKKIARLYRTHEMVPDNVRCLLEQGLVCMGIATRGGCGGLCPKVNMPCTGCYGPPEGVHDQGARMVAAIGSVLDINQLKGVPEEEVARRVEEALDALPDLAGTFYKYSLPGSLMKGKRCDG